MAKTKTKSAKLTRISEQDELVQELPKPQLITFRLLILVMLLFGAFLLFLYTLFLAFYHGQIYPGIKIAELSMSGLTPTQAKASLNQNFTDRVEKKLQLTYLKPDQQPAVVSLDLNKASPSANINELVDQAYQTGRSENYLLDLLGQFRAVQGQIDLKLVLRFNNQAKLLSDLQELNQIAKIDPVDASLSFTNIITVVPSQTGRKLDQTALTSAIESYLTFKEDAPDKLPLKTVDPKITTLRAQNYQQLLEKVKTSPIKLHFNNLVWTLDQPTTYSLLNLSPSSPSLIKYQQDDLVLVVEEISTGSNHLDIDLPLLDRTKLETYLKKMSDKINQPAKDARFSFNSETGRVSEFQAAQEGKELDLDQTLTLLSQALSENSNRDITLPVKTSQPKITTSNADSLGINTLLGEGVSHFSGSIDNRIFNIGLAASRVNGILVAPGETFSFNQAVGDISGASGYKPAYVIKSGRTVLDDGGGVCQVSTTLFRALLNAGLPITERTAHAYRVGYYEQGFPPGLDATVFAPTVDLKFKNDTPAYILIQSKVDGITLTFDLYGTMDGRLAVLSKPAVFSQSPPPPELRQDDPTLPKGTIKQVDWSAWGANVTFNRTVTRDGQTISSETWRSNYRPWQAIYLVGTKE